MRDEGFFTWWTLVHTLVWCAVGVYAWRARRRTTLVNATALSFMAALMWEVVEYTLSRTVPFWPYEDWINHWVSDPLTVVGVPLAWWLVEAGHRRYPGAVEAGPVRALSEDSERHFRWASVELVYQALVRLRQGWSALPARARRAWWTTLAAGAALMVGLSAALTWLTRSLQESGALGWEPAVLRWLESHGPLSLGSALWMGFPGNALFLWPLALVVSAVAAWHGRPLWAVAALAGLALVEVPVFAGWQLWGRERPQLILEQAQGAGSLFHSFPSGHMAQGVFFFGLLVAGWSRSTPRKGERAFAWLAGLGLVLVLIALGRLRLGAHWPTDLLGGALLGGAWLGLVLAALSRAERAAGQTSARNPP